MKMNDSQGVPYGSSAIEKQAGLSRDFLKQGKSIDWVISMVAGKDQKAQAKVLSIARELALITPIEFSEKLNKLRIDEAGNKRKK